MFHLRWSREKLLGSSGETVREIDTFKDSFPDYFAHETVWFIGMAGLINKYRIHTHHQKKNKGVGRFYGRCMPENSGTNC